jgi:hypothetical protein
MTGCKEEGMKLGWSVFGRMNVVFKPNIPLRLKKKVYDQCVLASYDVWMLNSRMLCKIQCARRTMELCMLGITRGDRKRNTWVKVADMAECVKKLKWHIARRMDGRCTREILEWYPRGCKSKQGRPSGRWADELRRMGWSQVEADCSF